MSCGTKTNWWIVAAVVCTVSATGASTAAERGATSAAKSGEAVSSREAAPAGPSTDPGAPVGKGGADTAGRNSGLAGTPSDAGNLTLHPSTASTANGRSTKGGGSKAGIESGGRSANAGAKSAAHGIDLIRPDDGYANLRRRATRSLLIAAGQKKKPVVVAPVALTPHPISTVGTAAEPSRNSAGVALPLGTGIGKPDSIRVPGIPVNAGLAKNSLGISLGETHRPEIHLTATATTAPVTGINGTTMGHAGAGGVGGPAKDRSAINGSALRPRF